MNICPNLSNPKVKQEFDELVSVLGENTAYYVWNENNGYGLDYAPNGAQSKLFQDLFDYYKDRSKAIEAKSKTLSKEFKQWFQNSKGVDDNNEPRVFYHGTEYQFDTFELDTDNKRGKHLVHPNVAFWFTDSYNKAIKYRHSLVYPVFLQLKNPAITSVRTTNKVVNTQEESRLLLDDQYDSVIMERFDKEGDNNGLIPTWQWAVKSPNQIKSIDNNGQFSLTDNNIYYYVRDNIKPSSTVSYYSGKQGIGKLFTGKHQSAKQVLTNIINNNFITEQQYELAQSVLNNIGDNVDVELVNNTNYFMAYQNGKIYINIDGFNSYSNYDVANAFLHELLHHFTVNKYANDKQFKTRIDSLFEKISEQFPESEYKRTGLYYGLTNAQEFISELYVNRAFRDAVLKKNMSLWRRILYTILNALKLVKLANRVQPDDIYQVYNSITDAINNRTLDPDLDNCGEIFFYKSDVDYKWLEYDAKKVIDKAMNGLKASEKALKARDKSPVQITRIQQDIVKYQLLMQKGEDQQVLAEFIDRADIEFNKVLKRIRQAVINPEILTNDDLKNFKNDFLDFYGPITQEINEKLFFQGYFDNLPVKQLKDIKEQLNKINKAYQEINGKYNHLLRQRVNDIVREYGKKYGVPTEDVEEFINDKLNSPTLDMNVVNRYFQFNSGSSDLGIRVVNRMITDINTQVKWFANNKTQDLIRQFENITKAEQQLYFEKDKDGKVTGYLVRKLNYGQFKKDYKEFLAKLDQKYGVVEENYFLLEGDDFVNYCREKEMWLEEHCERKFKNEYYREYNKLSQLARSKAKMYTEQISAIIDSVRDETGLHLERLSDSQWFKLDQLYTLKKNLSCDYYPDGTKKQGEDLDVAREFQRFYDAVGMGNIKSKQLSQAEILVLIHQKEKELPPELFEKWKQRNISVQFTDEFLQLLKGIPKLDFGDDAEVYESLYEERRQLLSLGRDNNNPVNVAEKYNQSVKKRILELDQKISDLRAKHSTGDRSFFGIAEIIPTPQYERDMTIHKAEGKESYDNWYKANHYRDSKGNVRIASYYTRIVPKEDKYYEFRLSRMNQELDKNSKIINPNYDFSDPEYYQPKASLYDNSKAYEAATKTKAQQDIYKIIVDTMNEANSKISYMSVRDNYRLPQATGDFIDFTMRNGNFFKNFGFMIKDSVVSKNDDVQFALDNQITKADGSQLLLIPTHYVKMIDRPETISRNLVGLLAEYSRMAENYRLKNQYASQFDVIQNFYDQRDFVQNNPQGLVSSRVEGSKSRTSAKLRDQIEMQIYGKRMKAWEWGIGKYKISVTKLLQNIRKYASASNLGNNFLSIAKSICQGTLKSIYEGFAKQFFSLSDLGKSYLRQLWHTPKRMMNIGNPSENDFGYALLEHNQIAHTMDEKFNGLQYKRGFRLFYKYLVWGGWQLADFMVKLPVVESVYANFKFIPEQNKFMSFVQYRKLFPNERVKDVRKRFSRLDTVSMLDVLTVKEGKLVIKKGYKDYEKYAFDKSIQQSLKNISSVLCARIDGQLNEEDRLMILQNGIGAAIGMHRSFFVVNANENILKSYGYNPLIEDYDDAKYTSGFVGIGKRLYNFYNEVRHWDFSNKKGKFTKKTLKDTQYYNSQRILMQITIWSILYIMVANWLRDWADEDKKNKYKQSIGYILDSLRFEEQSEYNPLDLINQIKSPSAMIAPFENLLNLVNPFQFSENYSTDKIKSGYYKDMEKWQRTLIKATPGLRGAWESQDARTKWQYLKSQLDK